MDKNSFASFLDSTFKQEYVLFFFGLKPISKRFDLNGTEFTTMTAALNCIYYRD